MEKEISSGNKFFDENIKPQVQNRVVVLDRILHIDELIQ
jgi:hypothetical protein